MMIRCCLTLLTCSLPKIPAGTLKSVWCGCRANEQLSMAQAQASTRQSLQRTDSDWERDMASLKDGSDAKVREALDGARKAWEAQFAKLRADSDGKLRQLLVSTTLFTALHSFDSSARSSQSLTPDRSDGWVM